MSRRSHWAYAEDAIVLAEENGFVQWLNQGRLHRGWALAELGQLKKGIAELEAAIADSRRRGGAVRLQYFAALLAFDDARMGETENALARLNAAAAHIERTGEKAHEAEVLRLKGELVLMHLMHYDEAIDQAEA